LNRDGEQKEMSVSKPGHENRLNQKSRRASGNSEDHSLVFFAKSAGSSLRSLGCASTSRMMSSRSFCQVVPEALMPEAQFRRGPGCEHCNNTGFSSRLPVTELLAVTEPFREAVLKRQQTSALEQVAIQQGMRTLWQKGLQRAVTGETTLEEIIRVVAADMI